MEEVSAKEDRLPIGEVLNGLEIYPLNEDETPVEAFVMIKARDTDGNEGWSFRTTKSPNREELIGVLTVQIDLLRRELLAEWPDD
jgi:hypothetical protein